MHGRAAEGFAFGLGEFFALAAAILWAISIISFRISGLHITPFSLNLFKNVVVAVIMVPTLLLLGQWRWDGFTPSELYILMFSGIIGITLGDNFVFRALNKLGAAGNAVVECLYSPFVALFSVLLLAEPFSWREGGGLALILAGVLVVNVRRPKDIVKGRDALGGLMWGALSMLMMSLAIILIKPIVEHRNVLQVTEIRLVAGVAGAVVWAMLHGRLRESAAEFRQSIPWVHVITGTICGTYLAMICWIAGYKYTTSSTAAILNQTAAIWTILFAAVFLKEHFDFRKLLGLVAAIGGILLVTM